MATSETPSTKRVFLVKSGQVGRAVLENLVEETAGATALLNAAKRSSECQLDLGPLPAGTPPLKTMKQVFMAEADKQVVKAAFDPLRLPQQGSDVNKREAIVIGDDIFQSNNKLGGFQIASGTMNQVTGMVNSKVLNFQYMHTRGPEPYFSYEVNTGEITFIADGIVSIAGELNLMMLPSGFERAPIDGNLNVTPIAYLNPTFLGTRGANECPYRLSYHHYSTVFTEKGVPDIFHQETLFEDKFTHYDVAKVVEKRHSFNVTIRCKAGDKLHFVLERGRSIVNFAGTPDVIRTVPYIAVTPASVGLRHRSPNQIGITFLTD